jgi:hypothetical protein
MLFNIYLMFNAINIIIIIIMMILFRKLFILSDNI